MKLNCSMCSSSALSVAVSISLGPNKLVYINPQPNTYSVDMRRSAPFIPLYRCSFSHSTCYWTTKVLATIFFSVFTLFRDCFSGSKSSTELRYLKGVPAKVKPGLVTVNMHTVAVAYTSVIVRQSLKLEGTKRRAELLLEDHKCVRV